ncbi:hypothetical protein [Paenarthrobacter sp. NPDC057981]|uniref:hypothetical protein n=1 Tax=Paenarthrobacter sp. NPDC057981 TaxID=3346297 RepID=UPI0036D7D25A
MTMVNWERESGDRVEEFAAALILLDNPQGNRITPSRGDGGIDLQVESNGQWDIYQVKKFAQTLSGSQKNQIKESWERFVAETLPLKNVRSWTLVMPWDPTREQMDWLDELTSGYTFEIRWWGRAHLDGLAAGRPAVVDYFFGDGGQRITALMEQMLALGGGIPDDQPRGSLLERIVERQQQIVQALSHVDPFYKYVVEIRTGNVNDVGESQMHGDARGASLVQYVQINDEQYAGIRVLPLSAESSWLRPIGGTFVFTPPPGSDQAAALADFLDYGAGFTAMPGELTDVKGPPGLLEAGAGLFSVIPVFDENSMPPLELQVSTPGEGVILRLPLTNVKAMGAPRGDGFSLTAEDASGTLSFGFKGRTHEGASQETFNFRAQSSVGKYPHDVLPAITFLAKMDGKNEVSLAVRGGRPLLKPLVGENGTWVRALAFVTFLEDLILIQQHTHDALKVPDLEVCSQKERDSVGAIAKMLRGEKAEGRWSTFTTDGIEVDHSMFSERKPITVVTEEPMSLTLAGVRTELDVWMRVSSSGVPESRSLSADGLLTVTVTDGILTSEMIEPPIETNE